MKKPLSKEEKAEILKKFPPQIPYKEGEDPILSIRHVDITFGAGRKVFKAVSDANFDIFKGETVSLVGESGSGKTTIGRAIVRINPCSAGAIYYKGQRISGRMSVNKEQVVAAQAEVEKAKRAYDKAKAEYDSKIAPVLEEKAQLNAEYRPIRQLGFAARRGDEAAQKAYEKQKAEFDAKKAKVDAKEAEIAAPFKAAKHNYGDAKRELNSVKHPNKSIVRRIQMIFQDPAASLNERATIEYIISEGLINFRMYDSEEERIEKVENIIKEVGLLPEHLTRYPHEFSGGQRQRVGIARSIVMEPEFIVADEPISALDVSIRAQVLNLLKKFQREKGLTYLFIAHDLSIVRYISDRIVVIHLGKIVEVAPTEELFAHPLHPYTASLISAIPIPDPRLEKEKNLFVYDQSIHHYDENNVPSLVDIGHGHFVFGSPDEIEEYRRKRESQ